MCLKIVYHVMHPFSIIENYRLKYSISPLILSSVMELLAIRITDHSKHLFTNYNANLLHRSLMTVICSNIGKSALYIFFFTFCNMILRCFAHTHTYIHIYIYIYIWTHTRKKCILYLQKHCAIHLIRYQSYYGH